MIIFPNTGSVREITTKSYYFLAMMPKTYQNAGKTAKDEEVVTFFDCNADSVTLQHLFGSFATVIRRMCACLLWYSRGLPGASWGLLGVPRPPGAS